MKSKKCKDTEMPILYYYPKKDVFEIVAAVSKEKAPYAVGIVLDDKDVVLFETTGKNKIEDNKYSIYSNAHLATKEDIQKIRLSLDMYWTILALRDNGCKIDSFRWNYIDCTKFEEFDEGHFIFVDCPH